MSFSRVSLSVFSGALGALYAAAPGEASSLRFPVDEALLSDDRAYLSRLFSAHVATRLSNHGRGTRASSPATPEKPSLVGPGCLQAAGLTLRESEVLSLIACGKRDAEIAVILDCAPRTVSKHVENMLAKFGVETRLGAVRVAQERLLRVG